MKTKILSLLTFVLMLVAFTSFSQTASKSEAISGINKGMIKVTIFYPNGDGKTFNMDYYSQKHMPMVKSLLGDNVKVLSIDKGLANGMPNAPLPYLAIGYLYFDSMAAVQSSMGGPASAKLMADIPNFTNAQPVIQISEVLQ